MCTPNAVTHDTVLGDGPERWLDASPQWLFVRSTRQRADDPFAVARPNLLHLIIILPDSAFIMRVPVNRLLSAADLPLATNHQPLLSCASFDLRQPLATTVGAGL